MPSKSGDYQLVLTYFYRDLSVDDALGLKSHASSFKKWFKDVYTAATPSLVHPFEIQTIDWTNRPSIGVEYEIDVTETLVLALSLAYRSMEPTVYFYQPALSGDVELAGSQAGDFYTRALGDDTRIADWLFDLMAHLPSYWNDSKSDSNGIFADGASHEISENDDDEKYLQNPPYFYYGAGINQHA